jgi:hypothetical protein
MQKGFEYECSAAPLDASINGKHGLYLKEVFPVNGGGFNIWRLEVNLVNYVKSGD